MIYIFNFLLYEHFAITKSPKFPQNLTITNQFHTKHETSKEKIIDKRRVLFACLKAPLDLRPRNKWTRRPVCRVLAMHLNCIAMRPNCIFYSCVCTPGRKQAGYSPKRRFLAARDSDWIGVRGNALVSMRCEFYCFFPSLVCWERFDFFFILRVRNWVLKLNEWKFVRCS